MPLQCWQMNAPTAMLMYVGPWGGGELTVARFVQLGCECAWAAARRSTDLLAAVRANLVVGQARDLPHLRLGVGHDLHALVSL